MGRETVEEIQRHFGVVSGQLRSDVRAAAEALDAFRADAGRRFEGVGREFDVTRALIRLSYTELDR